MKTRIGIEFNQSGHWDLKDAIGSVQLGGSCGLWCGRSPFTTESQLVVTAFDLRKTDMLTSSSVDDDRVEMISISYPWTTIETDINGTPEKNEIGFGKFKCPKSSRQGIAIDRVEILKEIRINRAPNEVLI